MRNSAASPRDVQIGCPPEAIAIVQTYKWGHPNGNQLANPGKLQGTQTCSEHPGFLK